MLYSNLSAVRISPNLYRRSILRWKLLISIKRYYYQDEMMHNSFNLYAIPTLLSIPLLVDLLCAWYLSMEVTPQTLPVCRCRPKVIALHGVHPAESPLWSPSFHHRHDSLHQLQCNTNKPPVLSMKTCCPCLASNWRSDMQGVIYKSHIL